MHDHSSMNTHSMDNTKPDIHQQEINRRAAYAYTGVSLLAAALFFFFASLGGNNQVARWGGAIWVFFLTMIVTMPYFIPYMKKKYNM